MIDDIVTRLRIAANELAFGWEQTVFNKAADEIERLRANRDRWNNVAELAMQAHVDDCWLNVYDAYGEAVRGD